MSLRLTRSLSVGLHVPSVAPQALAAAAEYTAFFSRAEALGFDALWVEDRIMHPAPMLDPMLLLTWAAACTQRMLLGTAVMVLNLRRAAVVARQVATLNHLSGERFVLGASLGGHPAEYAALGVPMSRRIGVLRDALKVVRALNTGEPLNHRSNIEGLGEMRYEDAVVRPAATVPLLMGGIAEPAIRRAGELADGWIMAPFGSLDDFASGWQLAQQGAVAAGRDPQALVAGRLLYVCADPDRARAREQLRLFLHCYYGDRLDVDRDGIHGTGDEVAVRLREQVEAGISHLMLGVPTLDREQLEYLAQSVLPVLRLVPETG